MIRRFVSRSLAQRFLHQVQDRYLLIAGALKILFSFPASTWVVIGIAALGAAVRLWGIGFGLPALYLPDETAFLTPVFKLMQISPITTALSDPSLFVNASFYRMLQAVTASVSYIIQYKPVIFDKLTFGPQDYWRFFLLGRLLTLVLGVATIPAIYRLAKELFDENTAVLAAFLFALLPAHVEYSRYILPQVPALFFSLWSLVFLVQAVRSKKLYVYGFSGGFAALAAATQLRYWVLLPILLVGYLGFRKKLPAISIYSFYVFVAAFAAVFLIAFPFPWLNSGLFLAELGKQASNLHFYFTNLLSAMGGVFALLGVVGTLVILAGLVYEGVKRRLGRGDLILCGILLVLFLVCFPLFKNNGDTLLLAPVLIILLARTAVALFGLVETKAGLSTRLQAAFLVVILAILIAEPAFHIISFVSFITRTSAPTQLAAEAWIHQNVAANSGLAVESFAPVLTDYPWVEREWALGSGGEKVADYLAGGYTTLVISDEKLVNLNDPLYKDVQVFRSSLSQYSLAAEFTPEEYHSGPKLSIYQLQPETAQGGVLFKDDFTNATTDSWIFIDNSWREAGGSLSVDVKSTPATSWQVSFVRGTNSSVLPDGWEMTAPDQVTWNSAAIEFDGNANNQLLLSPYIPAFQNNYTFLVDYQLTIVNPGLYIEAYIYDSQKQKLKTVALQRESQSIINGSPSQYYLSSADLPPETNFIRLAFIWSY